jgi:hypothetical protein
MLPNLANILCGCCVLALLLLMLHTGLPAAVSAACNGLAARLQHHQQQHQQQQRDRNTCEPSARSTALISVQVAGVCNLLLRHHNSRYRDGVCAELHRAANCLMLVMLSSTHVLGSAAAKEVSRTACDLYQRLLNISKLISEIRLQTKLRAEIQLQTAQQLMQELQPGDAEELPAAEPLQQLQGMHSQNLSSQQISTAPTMADLLIATPQTQHMSGDDAWHDTSSSAQQGTAAQVAHAGSSAAGRHQCISDDIQLLHFKSAI